MTNLSELYKLGGMQLLLAGTFIMFMWRMLKYFIAQMEARREDEKGQHARFVEERAEAHKLFNQALELNNKQVADWLERLATCLQKQEQAFQELIILIKTYKP